MPQRLRGLAELLDAHVISRREFLRRTALITGSTAAGLHVLGRMAQAQGGPKLRVWLFKSYVTAGNDILAKQVEAWAKEREPGLSRRGAGLPRKAQARVAGSLTGYFFSLT